MTINHINLIVTNVTEAIIFFETYFGFKSIVIKGNDVIAILKNEEDFTLVLMVDKAGDFNYPKDFHIGFMLDNAEKVKEIYLKLKSAGIIGESAPRKIRDSFGFYFLYDKIMIEVGTYLE